MYGNGFAFCLTTITKSAFTKCGENRISFFNYFFFDLPWIMIEREIFPAQVESEWEKKSYRISKMSGKKIISSFHHYSYNAKFDWRNWIMLWIKKTLFYCICGWSSSEQRRQQQLFHFSVSSLCVDPIINIFPLLRVHRTNAFDELPWTKPPGKWDRKRQRKRKTKLFNACEVCTLIELAFHFSELRASVQQNEREKKFQMKIK